MRKSILILACSLMASSLPAMSFADDVTILVQENHEVKWHESQPYKISFDCLVNDHFVATPTILEQIPQIPFADVSKIKDVEFWNYFLPKSYILKNLISVKHQKIFQENKNDEKSINKHYQIPQYQRQI